MSKSFNDESIEALRANVASHNAALGPAITAYKAALADLNAADDIVWAMQAQARLILAAEAVKDAASGIEADCRKSLAAIMVAIGAPNVRIDGFTVSVAEPKPKLVVMDQQAVPEEFLKPQPPKPDMDAIKAAYAEGRRWPGLSMSNGGAPYISIRQNRVWRNVV